MRATLIELIDRLRDERIANSPIIRWGTPVPVFGDIDAAGVATVGLNPSNREFVDASGRELHGDDRRFPSLRSLGLTQWSGLDKFHLNEMVESCRTYFMRNPYDAWFKRLDSLMGDAASYYGARGERACHLDLIPYATSCKWAHVDRKERDALLSVSGDAMGRLIRKSRIHTLILNGSTVVGTFSLLTGVNLHSDRMKTWSLPRHGSSGVTGFSHFGHTEQISGIRLKRRVRVLGYNHNIQSSFGVTREVVAAIGSWIVNSIANKPNDA